MAITAYLHVTPAGAGAKTGADWTNAYGEPEFEAYIEGGGLAAGNVIFIKEGTYTLDSAYNSSAIPGTAVSPIAFIGVKAGTTNVGAAVVYADWATGANRPFFDCVTFQIALGAFYVGKNISFQGSAASTITSSNDSLWVNCKFDNDNAASAARFVFSSATRTNVVNCEFVSAKCGGISANTTLGVFFSSFNTPDATNGIGINIATSASCTIVGCVFNTCGNAGISVTAAVSLKVVGCTFYETSVSVSATTATDSIAINNICEGNNTAGFKWTTRSDSNFFWGNHGNDARCTDMWDGVDTTTVFQDYEVTAGNPLFTTPGTDHSLQGSSPCLRTAEDISLGVGATVINGNKGAWQGFPEAARNTIINTKVEFGYAYLHLGVAQTGDLGSVSSQSSRSDSSYSHSSYSNSSSSHSASVSVSSQSTSVSSDSSPSSSSLSLEGDCIQAQITAKIKAILEAMTIAGGYHYDVAACEQARKVLEVNNRWPFILICENEPEVEPDLIIRNIDYIVWFFSDQDDELTGDNATDHDNEIAYRNRNAIADITKALNTNIYLDGLCENLEIEPGTHDLYVDGNTTLFGTWCRVTVTTSIDSTDPYKLR